MAHHLVRRHFSPEARVRWSERGDARENRLAIGFFPQRPHRNSSLDVKNHLQREQNRDAGENQNRHRGRGFAIHFRNQI